MSKFVLIGRIVGPRLPSEGLYIGGVGIRPLDEEEVVAFAKTEFTVGTGADFEFGASATPPRLRVHSGWMARFDVEAADAASARETVEREQLPRVLAALGSTGDRPYFIEIALILDEQKQNHFGGTGTFYNYGGPDVLPPPSFEDVQIRHALLETDSDADAAGRHLVQAERLEQLFHVVGPELGRAALLEYCLAIEVITARTASDARDDAHGQIEREQQVVVEDLARTLSDPAGRASVSGAAQLVRDASIALDRANWKQLDLQVTVAGDRLAVDGEVVAEARALMRFRNRRLAHGGASAHELVEAVREWFWDERARRIARLFLSAYLDSLAKTPPAAGTP